MTKRQTKMDSDGIRSEYQRDIHRIIYSDAFRRLRHKTQVFFLVNNDHISTRLEHVLHVAAASCTVARSLNLDEDLTHAIALGHDLGHAPFGHWGETVLTQLAQKHKINNGRFEHEIHGLRVVDRLARLDRERIPGLNLTFAVRDGIISHCGEDPRTSLKPGAPSTKDLNAVFSKKSAGHPVTYEGCIVRIVDKIVYAGRDLEDALKAKIITEDMIDSDLVSVTRILGGNNGEIVGCLIADLVNNGKKGQISLSPRTADALDKLIKWNYERIYHNPKVDKYKEHAKRGMKHLFQQLLADLRSTKRFRKTNSMLPDTDVYDVFREHIEFAGYEDSVPDAQIVLDFVAGMTDNYLIKCISEIFVPRPIA